MRKKKMRSEIQNFIEYCKLRGFSETTIRQYEFVLNKCISENGIILEEILKGNVFTKKTRLAIVNSFLKFLNNKPLVIPIKGEIKIKNYINFKDVEEIINGIEETSFEKLRDKVILSLLLYSGIRANELLQIKLTDIGEDFSIKIKGKGRKERIVFLPRLISELLEKYILILKEKFTNNDYLAVNLEGKRLSYSGLYYITNRYLGNISDKKGAHTLRHAFATYLAEKNVTPFLIAQLMGHNSLNTTMKYVNSAKDKFKRVIDEVFENRGI